MTRKVLLPFEQADSSSNRKNGGSGLGLPICKAYIDAMDGKLEITSEPGRGSALSFVVPLRKAEGAGEPVPVDYTILQGKRVLLVDDNQTNLMIAKIYLEESGCMVTTARRLSRPVPAKTMTWFSWIARCRFWMVMKPQGVSGPRRD